ncbi:MAG TPA: DNA mismatch repair endonuclease MutL [Pyrinomonadaceae bacterium]|nr:DNA mismatch repair endonuclease MutL [Pyrinomonadaceae bacterium]
MSKIRVLSDHLANQIAAGEVVERPASVAKELVENSIDAGARRVEVDVEAGGRRLLRVSDDGSGMTRDDAVLSFERHATSKIETAEDLTRIRTLGFRGEALASIASVARVELVTQVEGETEGTRVVIEGGRMRDVSPAARPRGTTITVRDLFFNVPARRKFLRSEATESFHLTNLITHYALAHPEIEFALTNNGREVLRAAPAASLRERAYQIFGAEFLENLLEVSGGHAEAARVGGYVSAPRERRSTRDAQYLFVNGRFVRDRLVTRALSEGFRTVLPQGAFPAALLFLEVPLADVDVNVHPAKTEVRFRRAAAVSDAVRDAVRAALATSGFLRLAAESPAEYEQETAPGDTRRAFTGEDSPAPLHPRAETVEQDSAKQEEIEFGKTSSVTDEVLPMSEQRADSSEPPSPSALEAVARSAQRTPARADDTRAEELRRAKATGTSEPSTAEPFDGQTALPSSTTAAPPPKTSEGAHVSALPPVGSVAALVREVPADSLSANIRPLGQLDESYIVATDAAGLLLIDQHAAHERILFDKYLALEETRAAESQHLLVPETFDLTPAQAAAFDDVSPELERYGFGLMRLSGRTVAVRAVPADLPASEARNLLAEILDSVDAERRGRARETLRERIAASLASSAAVKTRTPLTREKMNWLIERLLRTSSPTTSPHGRPIILRLAKRDIERSFNR